MMWLGYMAFADRRGCLTMSRTCIVHILYVPKARSMFNAHYRCGSAIFAFYTKISVFMVTKPLECNVFIAMLQHY